MRLRDTAGVVLKLPDLLLKVRIESVEVDPRAVPLQLVLVNVGENRRNVFQKPVDPAKV